MSDSDVIEGVPLDIPGDKLRDLLLQVADHHEQRKQKYARQIADIDSEDPHVEEYSNQNPVETLENRLDTHGEKMVMRHFQAEYIDPDKTYRLTKRQVKDLGINEVL